MKARRDIENNIIDRLNTLKSYYRDGYSDSKRVTEIMIEINTVSKTIKFWEEKYLHSFYDEIKDFEYKDFDRYFRNFVLFL